MRRLIVVALLLAGCAPAATPLTAGAPTLGLPNPLLTPGVANPAVTPGTIATTICMKGWTTSVRPPQSYTENLKIKQIKQYGYIDTKLGDYEEDHLIPLEVGGSPTDPGNLWPEPHSVATPTGDAGSITKDRFENWLNGQVCGFKVTLAEAQHVIATDWVSAWEAAGRP